MAAQNTVRDEIIDELLGRDSRENQLTNGRVVMGEKSCMLNRMPLIFTGPQYCLK